MNITIWDNLSNAEQTALLQRPVHQSQESVRDTCLQIIAKVKRTGDTALREFTREFDGAALNALSVSDEELANTSLSADAQQAISLAIHNLTLVQSAQLPETTNTEVCPGVTCTRLPNPIAKVGLYVPAGTAPLLSTVLMLAIPAKLANCPVRILCTPPNRAGKIDPHILYAARQCGIHQIYKVGGAQAIAAMAYGTESIPKVNKIFGPGNAWVTQAKMLVSQDPNGVAIDLPAGPSEILIIADEHAKATFVAADLLAQAEHDPRSQVILISNSTYMLEQVIKIITDTKKKLSRQNIINQSLLQARFIVARDLSQAVEISNAYAPEHLSLACQDALRYLNQVNAAGTVFIGDYAGEALGDYITGSNHVLPTNGAASTYSGLSVLDFMKFINLQQITAPGFQQIAKAGAALAAIEGLTAHQASIDIRLQAGN